MGSFGETKIADKKSFLSASIIRINTDRETVRELANYANDITPGKPVQKRLSNNLFQELQDEPDDRALGHLVQ